MKYDVYNRLVEVKENSKILETNKYNYKGLRVERVTGENVVQYVYDGDVVLLETGATKNITARNSYGLNLLARESNSTKGYYRYNYRGDVIYVVNRDGSKDLAKYKYDLYGKIIEEEGEFDNPFRYKGYMYDSDANYYYLNARMYDPSNGRFLQEDTYLGDPKDPLSLNRYTYCMNNPVKYYDPSGHIAIWAIIGIGAVVGGVFGLGVSHTQQKDEIRRGQRDKLDYGKLAKDTLMGAAGGSMLVASGVQTAAYLAPVATTFAMQYGISNVPPPPTININNNIKMPTISDRKNLTIKPAPNNVKGATIKGIGEAASIHPGKLAGESSEINQASIMRALRQSGSNEGRAVAKLLKRGNLKLDIAETHPKGWAGQYAFGENKISIYTNNISTPQSAAGYVTHEAKHYLQNLTPQTYTRMHEFEAYTWQRNVDRSWPIRTNSDIWNFINTNDAYKNVRK